MNKATFQVVSSVGETRSVKIYNPTKTRVKNAKKTHSILVMFFVNREKRLAFFMANILYRIQAGLPLVGRTLSESTRKTILKNDGSQQRDAYTGVETAQEAERMNKKIGKIVDLIFKAVALAMGVAVVVTAIMGVMDSKGQILLLGIGLFCLAITALDRE